MKKILIVEGEEILLDILQKKIKQAGYDVFAARDGKGALSKIKEIKPDLILLDLMLSEESGLNVLTEIKKNQEMADVPIIVISTTNQPAELEQAIKMGVSDYIAKTQFDPTEVLNKLSQYLGDEK